MNKFFEWIIWSCFWSEYWIEFLALFNVWMNNQNLSPRATTRRRSGTCTPMPAQSVLTKTWIFLQEVSACLRNYLQCSDPLKKPAITLSLSSLSSSPPTLAISALLGILYLEPSSSHLRRSQPAARIRVCEQLMAGLKPELNDWFLIAHQSDLPSSCPRQRSGIWCAPHLPKWAAARQAPCRCCW